MCAHFLVQCYAELQFPLYKKENVKDELRAKLADLNAKISNYPVEYYFFNADRVPSAPQVMQFLRAQPNTATLTGDVESNVAIDEGVPPIEDLP